MRHWGLSCLCISVVMSMVCKQTATVELRGDDATHIIRMEIPLGHLPLWYDGLDVNEVWFSYQDSSYIYYLTKGFNPNYYRIEQSNNVSAVDTSYVIKNINDTIRIVSVSGVTKNGLNWRNVQYYFCGRVNRRRRGIVRSIKQDYCVNVGYSRVSNMNKQLFDKAVESVRILPIDDTLITTHNSYNYNGKFNYLTDISSAIDTTCPVIDVYREKECDNVLNY